MAEARKNQLTLELLKTNIPLINEGRFAAEKINNATKPIPKTEMQKLAQARNKGVRAQEELLYAALPLIKSIASNEFQRRKNWNSRVSYDDIMQEAMIGFLRGLQSFKVESTNVSPTNYLGQWITVTIRRKVESMDHDFNLPYEMVERHRRIRAVKSRIENVLQRLATDAELLEALNASDQDGSVYKWGKVNKENTGDRAKVFTQKHIEEYRDTINKTYSVLPYELPSEDSDSTFELAASSLYGEDNHSYASVDAAILSGERQKFFNNIFLEMKIGSRQKDVILRYFGFAPYEDNQSVKEIVEKTGLPSKFVKSVVEAFSMYMPLKGGIFHKHMVDLDDEQVMSLELEWLMPILGEWPKSIKDVINPPDILTQSSIGS